MTATLVQAGRDGAGIELHILVRCDGSVAGISELVAEVAQAVDTVLAGRGPVGKAPSARSAPLRILLGPRQVLLHGRQIPLTRLEFDLLVYLGSHPGQVHDRRSLMREVWQHPAAAGERTVDVHIRKLRDKIGADVLLITTLVGVGYRFDGIGAVTFEP